MTDQIIDNDIHPVTTPDEAIDQFVGEQFIEWLMEYTLKQMHQWPEMEQLRHAQPKIEKLRKAMLQVWESAQAVSGSQAGDPGFLGFAIANLSESAEPEAESVMEILNKKRDDELNIQANGRKPRKDHHQELWHRLLKSLGATDEEISRAEPKEWTRNYIAELSDLYSNGQWQEVAGAFAASERADREFFNAILGVARANTQVSDHDLEILAIHSAADSKFFINTGHVLEKIVFDPENKHLIWQGVVRELAVRRDFLAALLSHLEN